MTTYYNLEKTAEVLGVVPGEVNRLREQGKLQGFRDGSNWKFRQSDVEEYLTKSIKEKPNAASSEEASDGNDAFLFSQDAPAYGDDNEEDSALEDDSDVVGDEAPKPTDSGVYVLGDDDDSQAATAASKIDLAGESGISLGSGGGLNLGVDSGISLLDEGGDLSRVDLDKGDVLLGGGSASQISFGGESSISLIPEEESFSLADDVTPSQPEEPEIKPATEAEIFELIGDPEPSKAPAASTSGEDFQLAPSADSQEESDSESSSQVITLADDNLFLSEDEDEGGTYNTVEDTPAKPAAPVQAAQPVADPFATNSADPFAVNSSDPFATTDTNESESGVNPFADMADMAGAASSTPLDPFSQGPATTGDTGVTLDFQASPDFSSEQAAEPIPQAAANTGGCSWALGRGCQQEAKYSGMEILFFLVPSLIILIPSAIAVFELVRSIWSWGEPYELPGTIVETIGNLVNLINK